MKVSFLETKILLLCGYKSKPILLKRIVILFIVCFATVFVAENSYAQSAATSKRAQKSGLRKKHKSKKRQKKSDWASVQRSNNFYHSSARRSVNKYGARGGRSNKTLNATRARSQKKTRRSYHATKSARKGGGLFKSKSGRTSKVK
jgi:hypothetical protein